MINSIFAGIPLEGGGARPLDADLYGAEQQAVDIENLSATGNLNIGKLIMYDENAQSIMAGTVLEHSDESIFAGQRFSHIIDVSNGISGSAVTAAESVAVTSLAPFSSGSSQTMLAQNSITGAEENKASVKEFSPSYSDPVTLTAVAAPAMVANGGNTTNNTNNTSVTNIFNEDPNIINNVVNEASDLIEQVVNITENIVNNVVNEATDIIINTVNIVGDVIIGTVSIVELVVNIVDSQVTNILELVVDTGTTLINVVTNVTGSVIETVTNITEGLLEQVIQVVDNTITNITGELNLYNILTQVTQCNIVETVIGVTEDITGNIINIIDAPLADLNLAALKGNFAQADDSALINADINILGLTNFSPDSSAGTGIINLDVAALNLHEVADINDGISLTIDTASLLPQLDVPAITIDIPLPQASCIPLLPPVLSLAGDISSTLQESLADPVMELAILPQLENTLAIVDAGALFTGGTAIAGASDAGFGEPVFALPDIQPVQLLHGLFS